MCNSSVDFVIRHDKKRVFRFASLQGDTAHQLVPEYAEEAGLSTVVLLDGGVKYIRSTAVAKVLKGLGGLYKFLGILMMILPRKLRDWGYMRVANGRYKRFGKRETCRLPTPEERSLFLP